MKRTQKHIAMEDKQLNAAESIALISRMIDNTRNRMLRNSGRPFLVWGYVTVFTTLLVMGAVYYFQNPKWNILWMLLPVLGALLMWLTRDKHTEGKVSTFVDRVINNVWLVMGLTAWFVSMLSLFSQIRLPILFIILLTMGMGTTITGLIIRFRPARRRYGGYRPRSRFAHRERLLDADPLRRRIRRDDDYPGTYPQLQVEPYERITQWTSRKYPKRKRWTSSLASSTAICAA